LAATWVIWTLFLRDAVAEGVQLGVGVFGMLATQARVLGRNAGAVGAVAASAGGDLAVGNAAAVDALAQGDQFLVLGETGPWRAWSHPVGDVLHVGITQRGGKALMMALALAGLELLQLLDQVFRVLLCQLGVGGMAGLPSAPWQAAHTAV
jgi:hypothetical protein